MNSAANPNSNNGNHLPKNVYHIGGLQVEFPYQPYGSQFAFMGRVISTLDRAQREGHCHALLESPTGTGKSLSLLCSSLAWQHRYKSQPKPPLPSEPPADSLGLGGGFLPEDNDLSSPSDNPELGEAEPAKKKQKKKAAPTIYYASRTHSQISQVIRELRKTTYRVPMSVLASRKHYCTNKNILGKENLDEECKLLLKDQEIGCPEFKNAHKVKGHPSLQKGGCNEVHDIEDLIKVGHSVKGCSYYAARNMSDDAQLVFCPYSYIINPVIRGAMDLDIKGAIVILDEAHNIEDITRDAGSVDIEEDVFDKLQMELQQLCSVNASIYQPLYEMAQGLTSWIERKKNNLDKRDFQLYVSCWTGDKALRELEEANISKQCFPILLECATKAIRIATDLETNKPHLSGMSVITLEGLFSSLTYFFSRNGSHMLDYQLALQRCVRKDAGRAFGNWTHTFSLWCLNPAVVFRDVGDLSLSIILTSGTLSPMNSFSSELGIQFETNLEAPHVIDTGSQVWPAIISTGPVGRSLEEIFNVVPDGCLVFFPSYKLMEKLCNRWSETEPRAGGQDDFESTLKGYYDSIRHGKRPGSGRKRRIKVYSNHFHPVDSQEGCKKGGAALLGVCRGKVSEGIDFSDDNARVVIIIGIPFPNINDIQVSLKKKYNDMYKSSKNLLSGSEWYCHQAFRALNQAAGRCIRHKLDYGAIIFLDERLCEERYRAFISKWLRRNLKVYDNFQSSIEGLKSFFEDAQERYAMNTVNVKQTLSLHTDVVNIKSQNKKFTRKKNQKLNKSCSGLEKEASMIEDNGSFAVLSCQDVDDSKPPAQGNSNKYNCEDQINPQCCNLTEERFNRDSFVASTHGECSIIKETLRMDVNSDPGSPGFSKDDNSVSTMIETSAQFSNHLSSLSMCLPDGSKNSSGLHSSITVTPEKNIGRNNIPETESPMNTSVNSHYQKRRKSMFSPFINLVEEENFNYITPCASALTTYTRSSSDVREETHGIEYVCERNLRSNTPQLPTGSLPGSCSLTLPLLDKRLQLFCSICKNPLGRPENHLYLTCSLISSSKVHLRTLLKHRMKADTDEKSNSVPVILTDSSSVDQRICNRIAVSTLEQGIWCMEDGCVFSSVHCPFCSDPNNLLGVQIIAANSSNIQLLEKILFYYDSLEVKSYEESGSGVSKDADLKPVNVKDQGMNRIAALSSIDKYSYCPRPEISEVSI
ncbi:hypothetical protein PIB30_026649 [Stylosanthes scabra]|uniref:Helicase ATP-binding domain-containing protein n=1 Tax=Stylosanthes scabra TaxID=79078 RepID=A0ABU6Y8Z4_9FABA|nr:hypothetical protein [Stylosanthes scabra]